MAVPKIRSGIRRQVVVGKAAADVDGDRGIRHAVIKRGCVGVAVEVNGVLFEQVRSHDHADVRQRQEIFVVLIEGHQRTGNIAVDHSRIHDSGGVGNGRVRANGGHARRTRAVVERIRLTILIISRGVAGRVRAVEHRREVGARLAVLDQSQTGERAERKHERLVPVGFGHHAVAARDLLALDRAAAVGEGQGRAERVRSGRIFGRGPCRRTGIRHLCFVRRWVYDSTGAAGSRGARMPDGCGWTLNFERAAALVHRRLSARKHRHQTRSDEGQPNLDRLSHGSTTSFRTRRRATCLPKCFLFTGANRAARQRLRNAE